MNRLFWSKLALVAILGCTSVPGALADGETPPGRDPKQPVDAAYTAKMKKYTTEAFFTSPLVDYLPASKNVPTPQAVLGDVSGAPGILPYAEDVYKYMRLLEKASPRVRVFSIGKTEEGREMIAVAVSSEDNLKNLEENRARSEEHTSELQSRFDLVCRLLLEKKKTPRHRPFTRSKHLVD